MLAGFASLKSDLDVEGAAEGIDADLIQKTAVQVRRLINEGLKQGASNLIPAWIDAFNAALALAPTCAEAWMCLGLALEQRRQFDLAYNAYAQATILTPMYTEARERVEALGPPLGRPGAILTPWIERPAPRLGARLSHAFKKSFGFQGRWTSEPIVEAEEDLRRKLIASPRSPKLAYELARRLRKSGRYLEAQHFLHYALALKPWYGDAAVLLSTLAETRADFPAAKRAALDAFKAGAADERLPFLIWWYARGLCDWTDEERWRANTVKILRKAPLAVPPLGALNLVDDPALHHVAAAATSSSENQGLPAIKREFRKSSEGPITLGYISADFREHAVGRLIAEVFELHDRARFRVIGFGVFNGKDSQHARRIRASFDKFIDLFGVGPADAAGRIANESVDILIDLTGHTEYSPGKTLALRPAPLQVNYLGYPGTRGAVAMDYILVDGTIVPRDQQRWFNEALAYLPECYQANDRKRAVSKKRYVRSDFGLPAKGVVYCSFNENRKITPELFRIWLKILERVPESVLWITIKGDEAAANLKQYAAEAQIDPSRLIFAKRVPNHEDHMARYLHCDFFLDTVIYNGHTTTSDALWAGCPGVALLGNTYPSRVAASLLQAAGLPELVVHSMQDYEDLAVRVGLDATLRHTLQVKLKAARPTCALFDTPRFVKHLESAYAHMWSTYVAGAAPQTFSVPALPHHLD